MSDDALFRLVGDGDRHSGGAIPLPDAFSAAVNELLARDDADFRKLNHIISDALRYKEDRIMAAAWRSWTQFTRDILTVLEEMNLIKENQSGRWELTEQFIPEHIFYLPGTKIGFTGRTPEGLERRNGNEALHMALHDAVAAVKDSAAKADPEAIQFILQADKILTRELGLDIPPGPSRYRQHDPREPEQKHKRLRTGMTKFFRDVFWEEYAEDGKWYELADIARKFEETHPDQPKISHSGDMMGSMRKAGRDMADAGVLESDRILDNGAWKNVFRKKTQIPAGYGPNVAVVPVVTWEGLKGNPKV